MGVELGIKKTAILHNFYILEPHAGGHIVYSGPSAKRQLVKRFKGADSETKAKTFLFSLSR